MPSVQTVPSFPLVSHLQCDVGIFSGVLQERWHFCFSLKINKPQTFSWSPETMLIGFLTFMGSSKQVSYHIVCGFLYGKKKNMWLKHHSNIDLNSFWMFPDTHSSPEWSIRDVLQVDNDVVICSIYCRFQSFSRYLHMTRITHWNEYWCQLF